MEQNNAIREEVLRKGEAIYLDTLKQNLEVDHMGKYVAIDVNSQAYLLDADKSVLIKKAQEAFGKKLFYMVQVGNLEEPSINFRDRKNVAWIFAH